MLVNIILVLGLVALVALFGWLTKRAWGSKRKILKWFALVLAGLLTLLLAVVALVGGKGVFSFLRHTRSRLRKSRSPARRNRSRAANISRQCCARVVTV